MSRTFAQATSILASWLDHAEIPHEKGQLGAHIAVRCKDAPDYVQVVFYKDEPPEDLPETHICVPGTEVITANLQDAVCWFHLVTDQAGWGTPAVPVRPVAPGSKKTKCPNLALLRHRDLHAAPNPSNETLAEYAEVMRNMVRWFERRFHFLCRNLLIEREDLMQLANMWTVSFLHHSRLPYAKKADENKRLLTHQLRQRFAEYGKSLMRQRAGLLPTMEDFVLATTGLLPGDGINVMVTNSTTDDSKVSGSPEWLIATPHLNGERQQEEEADPELERIENLLDVPTKDRKHLSQEDRALLRWAVQRRRAALRQRRTAGSQLDKHFEALPHDRMVEALTELSQNDSIAADARYEARRRLERHTATCDACHTDEAAA